MHSLHDKTDAGKMSSRLRAAPLPSSTPGTSDQIVQGHRSLFWVSADSLQRRPAPP
jgi:hypothetical protein